MKFFFLSTTLGVCLFLAGCATTDTSYTRSFTGDPVVDGRNIAAHGPARDKVLWDYKTALTAMRRGQHVEAKELLDDAILSMGGIISKDKNARQARGLFHGESKKTYIGEPYERVMAYYYRGILYWMDGEPDNARACFRSAQLIDSDSENKSYSADYTLLDYLDGLATTKLSGDGSDALDRARKVAKGVSLPDYNRKANVLIFIESGKGPTKYAGGEYGEALLFSQGQSVAKNALVRLDGKTISAPPYDDLNFQATTRGGRVMDQILANKAGFKSTTDSIGDAGIIGGAVLAGSQQGHHSNADEVGAGLLAFGLLSKIVSSATTPAADVRCWDNLPQYLSFTALHLSPGVHSFSVEFTGAQGQPLPNLTKNVSVNVLGDSRDTVIFVSDQSTNPKTI